MILANTRAEPDTAEAHEARHALGARLRSEGNVLADAPPPLLADDASPSQRELVRGWIAAQDPSAIEPLSFAMNSCS